MTGNGSVPRPPRIRLGVLEAAFLIWAAVAVLLVLPAAATGFDDDDGGVHEPAFDALASEGILEGTECGEGLICPHESFRRWIMAVWMVRALDEFPSAAPTRFADVDPGRRVVVALCGTSRRVTHHPDLAAAGMLHRTGPILPRRPGEPGTDGHLARPRPQPRSLTRTHRRSRTRRRIHRGGHRRRARMWSAGRRNDHLLR